MGNRLVWICEICGQSIQGSEGMLALDQNKMMAQRDVRHLGNAGTTETLRWHVRHDRCDKPPVPNPYTICCSQLPSLDTIPEWRRQLDSKLWATWTDWDEVVAQAVAAGERR